MSFAKDSKTESAINGKKKNGKSSEPTNDINKNTMLLKLEAYHNERDLEHVSESVINQEIAEGLAEHILPRMNVTKNTDGLGRVRITGEVIVLSKEDANNMAELLNSTTADTYTKNKIFQILKY